MDSHGPRYDKHKGTFLLVEYLKYLFNEFY